MIYKLCFVTPDGADDALILAAIRGGATMIQLRDKTATDAEMLAQAKRVLPECLAQNVPLIINDRVDVAIASGSSGLHIGQSDGDVNLIRAQLLVGQILGLSIGDFQQLSELPSCVDYIGVGPVWHTGSKKDAAAPIGPEMLAEIASKAPVPTLAIGGISLDNLSKIDASKVAGIAVISAISSAPNPEVATREILQKWSNL